MIIRQKYLDELLRFRDQDLIKVVTGVRRCGKSTLLDMARRRLADEGVAQERLLSFRMESMEFDGIGGYRDLYSIVRERAAGVERPYLFFDELQQVEGWERAINALRVDLDCDIYVTGSNAFLLSSELSTFLSGRYVEVEMLPLTFAEYLDFRGAEWFGAGSAQADDTVNVLFANRAKESAPVAQTVFRQFRQRAPAASGYPASLLSRGRSFSR